MCMMSISSIKFALIFLMSYMTITTACTCNPPHPQTIFCNSEYVIKGTPVKMREENMHFNGYTFENVTFYKSKDTAELGSKTDTIDIYTLNQGGSCGVRFDLNDEYIFSAEPAKEHGYLRDSPGLRDFFLKNPLEVGLCGFNDKWNKLTDFQRAGITETYKLGCPCDIVNWRNSRRIRINQENCRMEDYSDGSCVMSYSACIKTNDSCEFTRSDDLTQCLNSKEFPRHPYIMYIPI